MRQKLSMFLHGQGWIQGSSSDFQKSLKCFQTCVCYSSRSYCKSRNQLSLFYFYYEIKKIEKSIPSRYFVNHTAHPVLFERIRRVSICTVSSFVDTSENNAKKLVGTTGESFSPWVGLYGIWIMSNHSKPSSIGQKHSHCFANYSKSVMIGYSGCKLPWKLLTIVYKGKSPLESPFVCS